MIRFKLIGAVILASVGTFGFNVARAQDWTKLSSPFVVSYTTPYFLNANVGFTFNDGIIYDNDLSVLQQPSDFLLCLPELARTTNGGLTWSALNFFDTSGYSITQLSFVSLTHGYASATPNYKINNGQALGGIFETFDQGSHWKKITPDGLSFSSVYATKHAIFASEASEVFEIGNYHTVEGAILYSRDDGSTWDSITNVAGLTLGAQPQFQLIYGNRDSLVATVYYANSNTRWTKLNGSGDTYLVFSTDLGKIWNSTLLNQSYQWAMVSLHISPHSCNILREFIYGRNGDDVDDTYSFLESSPPYDSWDTALSHRETGAWIAGTSCESYLSDAADGQGPGDFDSSILLFRSTDEGASWNPMHKERGNNPEFTEIDDYDWQNLSVVGYGAVIYACDNGHNEIGGSYWKSTDGGDGTLSAAALAPRIEFAHGAFESGNDTLFSPCSSSSANVYYQNLSCAITKMDSISLTGLPPDEYTLTSMHHNDCLSLPDNTSIVFDSVPNGTYPLTVHAHFTDDEYNTIDTTLSFTLVVIAGNPKFSLSATTLFVQDTISCDSLTRAINFSRTGCFPPAVWAFSVVGADSSSFQASNLSNDSIVVTMYGIKGGNQNALLILQLNNGTSDTVALAGYVNLVPNKLSASPSTVFESDTVSCDTLTQSVIFSRTGCFPPLISTFSVAGADSASFQASNLSNDSILVTMYGIKGGNQNALLILQLDNGTSDTVALAGYVNLVPNKLSASPSTVFESDTVSCDTLTRSVIFSRTGCFPPSVSSFSVVGADSASFQASNLSTDSILVTLYGTKQGNQNAKLVLKLNDGTRDTLSLAGYVNLQPNIFTILPANITTAAGDTLEIPVYLSGYATLDSTSITLPFGIDTNILQPIGFYPAISGITVGSIVYSGGTGTVPLQSTGLTLNGETLIGTLRCIVYLADTLATSVTLQAASLTSANSPCVELSLTTDSVNIAITGCGTATLLQFMKTGKISLGIKSIAPNPSAGEVQVSFINPLSSSISYQVIDMLGTVRTEGKVTGGKLTMDVHSLPNGLYYLRAVDTETGASVSGRFMVEK